MRRYLFQWILACLITLGPGTKARAQSILRASDSTKESSSLRASLAYKSNYFYMGRSDSAQAPYMIPSVGYYHKSGVSLYGSLAYLLAENQNRIDLYTLSAGYDHFGKKIAAGISLSEYIFDDASYNVQAEMNTYLSGYIGYDLGFVLALLDVGIGFSDNADLFLGLELSKTLYLLRDRFRITPALYTNLGTQQYYDEYYSQRSMTTGGNGSGRGHGSGQGGSGTDGQMMDMHILESEKFRILDYEAGVQAAYVTGSFRWSLSATWMFPVNPSTVETIDQVYKENLKTGFLWTAGVRYEIKSRRNLR